MGGGYEYLTRCRSRIGGFCVSVIVSLSAPVPVPVGLVLVLVMVMGRKGFCPRYLLSNQVRVVTSLDLEGAVVCPKIYRIGDAGDAPFIDLSSFSVWGESNIN